MASEDIGNADPRGLQIALNAWDTYSRLGSPEGELAIAHAIVYLACAPKSNAVYMAYNEAMRDAKNKAKTPVEDDAIFRIYSTTKQIATVALLRPRSIHLSL